MNDDTDKPEIKPGTLVKLKSGGPRMTVNSVDGEECEVVWFVGDDYRGLEGVRLAALRVVSETEPA
jgi:uncharacterized protein YodC (DUF2158 family)